MFRKICLLIGGLGVAVPSIALAHATLLSPVPRTPLTLKTGPCGGIPRTQKPAVFETGATIEVTWSEYIDHPGYFRILFSAANDANFVVLLDNIADKKIPSGQPDAKYSAMVTLPSQPCQAGTLQLIQVMTENPASPQLYFSCADVCLIEPGTPEFFRGDANLDGVTDLSDAIALLFDLFVSGENPACADAADANDDGAVNLADPLLVLKYLFQKGGALPFPSAICGPDLTEDSLPACQSTCP
jgi:hypothetical protein